MAVLKKKVVKATKVAAVEKKAVSKLIKVVAPKKATVKKIAVRKTAGKQRPAAKAATRKRTNQAVVPAVAVELLEEKVAESKYYAGPVIQKYVVESNYELPAGYGDNRIVLMVRDPYWLHTYWEVNDKRRSEIINEVGEATFNSAKECLRVYDVESWHHYDIELNKGQKNWYINVPQPNRTYCVDIGYKTADGRFIAAARSNWVTTPMDRMSDVIDEQWMIPDWDMVYALSGGFSVGRGSEEIRELMKKRMAEESSSGGVFSLSSPVRLAGERPFWLVANCELIVYGATEPSAIVTIQGRKINLREDGTFSLRFALPDGQQVIPIEAIRDDGQEKRKITPIVDRKTE